MTKMYRTRQAATAAAAGASSTTPTTMDLDLPVDPNEPTYCICNQVSFGEMVACDNPNVCTDLCQTFSPSYLNSVILIGAFFPIFGSVR